MTSDEELLRLLQEYNRVHLEVVRCIGMRLTTHSEAPSNTMGSVATPERSRTPASGRSIERERTQTSPYGRVVRVREDWNPEEVETFVDLLNSFPNKPPAYYIPQLQEYGFSKSITAIQNKIKTLDQSARRADRIARDDYASDVQPRWCGRRDTILNRQ
jgi:hypothetical protein